MVIVLTQEIEDVSTHIMEATEETQEIEDVSTHIMEATEETTLLLQCFSIDLHIHIYTYRLHAGG